MVRVACARQKAACAGAQGGVAGGDRQAERDGDVAAVAAAGVVPGGVVPVGVVARGIIARGIGHAGGGHCGIRHDCALLLRLWLRVPDRPGGRPCWMKLTPVGEASPPPLAGGGWGEGLRDNRGHWFNPPLPPTPSLKGRGSSFLLGRIVGTWWQRGRCGPTVGMPYGGLCGAGPARMLDNRLLDIMTILTRSRIPMHPEPVSATRRSAATQTGPLRSGNPRGDPNLAPRCGAKARQTGCACRAPAMANGRCRMHGGASTGARTAAGLHRLAAVNTIHGRHAAGAAGDEELRIRTILRRTRLAFAADFLRAFLSPELAAALETRAGPAALATPRYGWRAGRGAGDRVAGDRDKTLCTSGGGTGGRDARGRFAARPRPELRGQAAAQAAARAEAAALAPWREAIARARLAKRTVRLAKRAARAARVAERAAARAAQIDAVGKKSMHQDGRPLAGLACGGSAQRPHTPRDIGVDEAGGSRRARMAGVARALRGQFGSDGAAAGDLRPANDIPWNVARWTAGRRGRSLPVLAARLGRGWPRRCGG